MKRNKELILFFLIILIGFVSFYFDSEISKGVSLMRNGFLDSLFFGLIFFSSKAIVSIFLTGLLLFNSYKRRWIFPLWLTLGLSVVVGFLLKVIVQRSRPFQQLIVSVPDTLISNSHTIWNFSFPSFRTMLVFCALPIISKEYPKFKRIWVIFGLLVAFSRVYFGVHFMSDVIAGGLIGYLIGVMIVKFEEEKNFGLKVSNRIFRK